MKKIIEIISITPLFRGLPPDQLEKIKLITKERLFNKGGVIFWEGDKADGFYIIATGMVKIYKLATEGKEQILHILGPGEPFGEVPVFTGEAFPANAQAINDSRILFIPRSAFISLITLNPFLAMNMLAVLSHRLRQFSNQIESLSLKEVPGRLAAYLIYLSEKQDSDNMVHLDISKGQLASLLGTIPETLSRVFSKMTDQGLIDVKGKNVRILNLKRVKRTAKNGKV